MRADGTAVTFLVSPVDPRNIVVFDDDAMAEQIALAAPRAAAELAGVDVDAVAAAAAARSGGLGANSIQQRSEDVLSKLTAQQFALLATEVGMVAAPPYMVPALIALAAHACGRVARLARQNLALAIGYNAVPRARARFFDLAERGAIRAAEAALRDVLRPGRSRRFVSDDQAAPTIGMQIDCTLLAVIRESPKRLGGAPAAAWAAAAPRLDALLKELGESADSDDSDDLSDGDRHQLRWVVERGRKALALLVQWAPKARQAAEDAAWCHGGTRCSWSIEDGGDSIVEVVPPPMQRCCASCGRTPANGARLHRCRGCGAFTGVMYCDNACARGHWLWGGHRAVCEPVSAQLRELKKAADLVLGSMT